MLLWHEGFDFGSRFAWAALRNVMIIHGQPQVIPARARDDEL